MTEDFTCACEYLRIISASVAGLTYHRLPAEHHLGFTDVRSSPLRVILGLGKKLDLAPAHCVCGHGSALKRQQGGGCCYYSSPSKMKGMFYH